MSISQYLSHTLSFAVLACFHLDGFLKQDSDVVIFVPRCSIIRDLVSVLDDGMHMLRVQCDGK